MTYLAREAEKEALAHAAEGGAGVALVWCGVEWCGVVWCGAWRVAWGGVARWHEAQVWREKMSYSCPPSRATSPLINLRTWRVKRWSATSAAAFSRRLRLLAAPVDDGGRPEPEPEPEAKAGVGAAAAPAPVASPSFSSSAERAWLARSSDGADGGAETATGIAGAAVAAADCVGVKLVESRSMMPPPPPPPLSSVPPMLVLLLTVGVAAVSLGLAATVVAAAAAAAATGGRRCQRSASTRGKASSGSMLSSGVCGGLFG